MDSYEGKSILSGTRSLTYRARIGSPDRTLVEEDVTQFRRRFEKHLDKCKFTLRK